MVSFLVLYFAITGLSCTDVSL